VPREVLVADLPEPLRGPAEPLPEGLAATVVRNSYEPDEVTTAGQPAAGRYEARGPMAARAAAAVAELPLARVRGGESHTFVVAALPSVPAVGPDGPKGDRGPQGERGASAGVRTRAAAAEPAAKSEPEVVLAIAPAVLECEVTAVVVATRSLTR